MKRLLSTPLTALFLATVCQSASAQGVNFGQPLVEMSATADARTTGVEASFTFLLHGGLAVYKLKESPLEGPNTGLRLDLGIGLGDRWGAMEAFHFSGGFSVVSDPSPLRDHRVNGLGLFAQADLTVSAHIVVGAYAVGPLAKGHDFGTVGLKAGFRLPPYR